MTTSILLIALAIGQPQGEKAVTAAEKKAFLKLLAKLPSKGEFFTDEAVKKAVPYTRVLLALTEKDLAGYDPYPFLALSAGLMDHKEPRRYGRTHFGKIAHPTLKLAWAMRLSGEDPPPPEVLAYLRKALDSKETARTLAAMAGPGFEEFRQRILEAYEASRQTKVVLVKRHAIKAFAEYSSGFGYRNSTLVFGPGPVLHAVRPQKQRGELTTYDLATGTVRRLVVPQPKGFQAKFDFASYFGDPVLSVNARGDVFCRWTIEGNGDHGLALLTKGSKEFLVERVEINLADSLVLADPDGIWYLIQGAPRFTVYRVEKDLSLTRLGDFAGKGHHSVQVVDARFLTKDLLHLFWGDVLSDNHLRMRCVDFAVKGRKWLHDRELFRLDKFVSSANEPTVLQLEDGSLHYVWRVNEGAERGAATGLYYQAEADGKTVKVSDGYRYRATAVGGRIVLCYTREKAPEKVFFRVVRRGALGPETGITVARGYKHNLWGEDMVLHAESGRLWFVNTLDRNSVYELRMVSTPLQPGAPGGKYR
jgi:hypothetical protein